VRRAKKTEFIEANSKGIACEKKRFKCHSLLGKYRKGKGGSSERGPCPKIRAREGAAIINSKNESDGRNAAKV